MLIVTSDTGLLQISSLAHRRITLDEYMARTYPEVSKIQPPYLIRNWNVWEFTDGREMTIAGLIVRRNAQFAQHIVLRSGHEVQIQDFKDKSNVLIGSPISNPWAQLYEGRLNFRCDLDENGRILFLEKSTSGAITQYPNDDDNRHNRTYARIAFLPATSDVAPSLLIAGTTAQSTEAAGELLLDKSRFGQTLRSMGIDPGGPPRFFEILIRSSNFVEAPFCRKWWRGVKPIGQEGIRKEMGWIGALRKIPINGIVMFRRRGNTELPVGEIENRQRQ